MGEGPQATRRVSCRLGFRLSEPSVLALQVAAATGGQAVHDEQFDVTLDGAPLMDPIDIVPGAVGGRTHVVRAAAGVLDLNYSAAVTPLAAAEPVVNGGRPDLVHDDESIVALRQSRYCPSDELMGFAATEFGGLVGEPDLGARVASWVFERLAYEPGSSGPTDTAIDTLMLNAGVCRDYAHVTIALCRALGLPARMAAVYAPGLTPMEFHTVVEVRAGSAWEVLDPTRLAPRPSLVRIATGRDAADTAFSATLKGDAELTWFEVGAVVDGDLPLDDHRARCMLP